MGRLVAASVLTLLGTPWVAAEYNVPLINGLTVRGSVVEIASLDQNAFKKGGSGEVSVRPIWMVDDGLRRVFVHERAMVAIPQNGIIPEVPDQQHTLEIDQPVPSNGKTIASVGGVMQVSRFNAFGRRQIVIPGSEGEPLLIWQGITEVTPRYTKLSTLNAKKDYLWDSRVATSSISRSQLRQILHKRLAPLSLSVRLEIVRFFIAAEMFDMARLELMEIIEADPEQRNLEKQLTSLVEAQAEQLLSEAKLRQAAGQYALAERMMRELSLEDFAAVTRLKFQDALQELTESLSRGPRLLDQLEQQVDALEEGPETPLRRLVAEMRESISPATISRLSDYERLGGDEAISLEGRVALAVGGWILGPGSGLQNLALARSLIRVRDLVADYLASRDEAERAAILDELRLLEGADVETIAKLLPQLPPPLPLPERDPEWQPNAEQLPGMFELSVPGPETLASEYLIQLPPEYDPLKQYPTVLSLHPPGGSARAQLEWWCGGYNEALQMRLGQATRHGFIVIAPRWTRPGQQRYEYTEREHHRVLRCLRDAMRRVSIDADRVFISGHGEGGTAAWDIAFAHPDYWAGLASISGEPGKHIVFYERNARGLPLYLIFGELAGSQAPLIRFGYVLDDYMHPRHNAMVVMYRGRGPENFQEEIHHLFDWMKLQGNARRDPPKEIEVVTMRGQDRAFWWLELAQVNPKNIVNPFLWDQVTRKPKATIKASVLAENTIRIGQGPADRFTVWLHPSMGIDLDKQIILRYKSRSKRFDFDGDIRVILDDARTRADRKRPFWGKIEMP